MGDGNILHLSFRRPKPDLTSRDGLPRLAAGTCMESSGSCEPGRLGPIYRSDIPKSTCHRYFQAESPSGVFAKILMALAEDLRDRGGMDLSEGFIDGTFAPAKKGAMVCARPKGAKAPKSWALQTVKVFLSPLALPVRARIK